MDSARTSLDGDYESFPLHTRLPNDETTEAYARYTIEDGRYDLLPYEEQWKARGPLLESKGCYLRPRYQQEWQPSWIGTNINPFFCEDSIDSTIPHIMDAEYEDGVSPPRKVVIKATYSYDEAEIAVLLNADEVRSDPRNHCVPILDVFAAGNVEPGLMFLTMPLLRAFNDPPFVVIEEVIDFIDQLLDGVEFMHSQGVAHRDITPGNIMMEATTMYPEGFHPIRQQYAPNGLNEVVPIMRAIAKPIYYIIDFDSAIYSEPGMSVKDRMVRGRVGRNEDVPEFKHGKPYDPFMVDIFQLGDLLRKEFLQNYPGLDFLTNMVRDMTNQWPRERPNISQCIDRFMDIKRRFPPNYVKRALSQPVAPDPLRAHLESLGVSRVLDEDPEEEEDYHEQGHETAVEGEDAEHTEVDEESEQPTGLELKTQITNSSSTVSLSTTNNGLNSQLGSKEDLWESAADHSAVTAETSPSVHVGAPEAEFEGQEGMPNQWKSPYHTADSIKSPSTIVAPTPMPAPAPLPTNQTNMPSHSHHPTSPADIPHGHRGKRVGPLPFFARSASPSPSADSGSPTSPIAIQPGSGGHHHRKSSLGGSGGLNFLKTGKFPWGSGLSASPSSRSSTPDGVRIDAEFAAFVSGHLAGGTGALPSPTGSHNMMSPFMPFVAPPSAAAAALVNGTGTNTHPTPAMNGHPNLNAFAGAFGASPNGPHGMHHPAHGQHPPPHNQQPQYHGHVGAFGHSPSNSWSKAMNNLHGFMTGRKGKGRERSNSKLSIDNGSPQDMANWGVTAEELMGGPPPPAPPPVQPQMQQTAPSYAPSFAPNKSAQRSTTTVNSIQSAHRQPPPPLPSMPGMPNMGGLPLASPPMYESDWHAADGEIPTPSTAVEDPWGGFGFGQQYPGQYVVPPRPPIETKPITPMTTGTQNAYSQPVPPPTVQAPTTPNGPAKKAEKKSATARFLEASLKAKLEDGPSPPPPNPYSRPDYVPEIQREPSPPPPPPVFEPPRPAAPFGKPNKIGKKQPLVEKISPTPPPVKRNGTPSMPWENEVEEEVIMPNKLKPKTTGPSALGNAAAAKAGSKKVDSGMGWSGWAPAKTAPTVAETKAPSPPPPAPVPEPAPVAPSPPLTKAQKRLAEKKGGPLPRSLTSSLTPSTPAPVAVSSFTAVTSSPKVKLKEWQQPPSTRSSFVPEHIPSIEIESAGETVEDWDWVSSVSSPARRDDQVLSAVPPKAASAWRSAGAGSGRETPSSRGSSDSERKPATLGTVPAKSGWGAPKKSNGGIDAFGAFGEEQPSTAAVATTAKSGWGNASTIKAKPPINEKKSITTQSPWGATNPATNFANPPKKATATKTAMPGGWSSPGAYGDQEDSYDWDDSQTAGEYDDQPDLPPIVIEQANDKPVKGGWSSFGNDPRASIADSIYSFSSTFGGPPAPKTSSTVSKTPSTVSRAEKAAKGKPQTKTGGLNWGADSWGANTETFAAPAQTNARGGVQQPPNLDHMVQDMWDFNSGTQQYSQPPLVPPEPSGPLPWSRELTPDLLRSLNGPPEYSSDEKSKVSGFSSARASQKDGKSRMVGFGISGLSDGEEDSFEPSKTLKGTNNPLKSTAAPTAPAFGGGKSATVASTTTGKGAWGSMNKTPATAPVVSQPEPEPPVASAWGAKSKIEPAKTNVKSAATAFGASKLAAKATATTANNAKKAAATKSTSEWDDWSFEDGKEGTMDDDMMDIINGKQPFKPEPPKVEPPKPFVKATPAPAPPVPAPAPAFSAAKGKNKKGKKNGWFDEEEETPAPAPAPPAPASPVVLNDSEPEVDSYAAFGAGAKKSQFTFGSTVTPPEPPAAATIKGKNKNKKGAMSSPWDDEPASPTTAKAEEEQKEAEKEKKLLEDLLAGTGAGDEEEEDQKDAKSNNNNNANNKKKGNAAANNKKGKKGKR